MKPTTTLLRELLSKPGIILGMGAHDVFTGLVLEDAGFECLFLGGFGVSASAFGLPDLNLLGLGEMAEAVRRMARRLKIPLIADGDTGHGGPHNVARTVAEFEAAGSAGVILEDQEFPKRCGHFEGKRVIPTREMLEKWKAALGARASPDFVLVARTDARGPNGLEDAIDRVNRYCEAGADVAFVEAPLNREELEAIARRVPHPKLANMLTFGKTPIVPAVELEQMGYKIMVAPIETLLVTARAIRKLASELLKRGAVDHLKEEMVTFDDVKRLLGLEELLSLAEGKK